MDDTVSGKYTLEAPRCTTRRCSPHCPRFVVSLSKPGHASRAIMADPVKRAPPDFGIEVEGAGHGFRLSHNCMSIFIPERLADDRPARSRSLWVRSQAAVSVKPLHEWKILDVAFRANGDESTRDQIGSPLFGEQFAVQTGPTGTLHASAIQRQLFHGAAARAIVPTGETDERNELVGVLDARAGLSVFGRKPEMRHVETCLKALFAYEPVGRAFVLGEGPFVEPSSHQRFVTAEVHDSTNAERVDELGPSDRSEIRHGWVAFLFRDCLS